MPHSLDLPRMLGPVIKLMRSQRRAGFCRSVVHKFIALATRRSIGSSGLSRRRARLKPGFAAIIGALDDLPKPSARLRSVNSFGIDRRSLQMIKLPAGEVWSADVPFFALAIRSQHKRSLACSHQQSNRAHLSLLVRRLNRLGVVNAKVIRKWNSDPLGPESCGAARKSGVEALTGERAGRVFSRVRSFLRDNQRCKEKRKAPSGAPKSRGVPESRAVKDPVHVRRHLAREPGDPKFAQGRSCLGTHGEV